MADVLKLSRIRGMPLAALAVAAAALAACGGDGDTRPGATGTAPALAGRTSTAAATAAPTERATPAPVPTADVAATPTTAASSGSAPALCDLAIADASPGAVASPDLVEISGMAASRKQEVIWAHNDSGDAARVFAVGLDGAALATYTVGGAEAVDWEDMAIGPGPEPGVSYLYLGDIGDNAAARPNIVVYRAPEPTVDPASSTLVVDADAIALSYPDGAHDAETLLVDPVTGDLFIITKDVTGGPSGLYAASAEALRAPPVTLQRVAAVNFAALEPRREIPDGSPPLPSALPRVPTGGDISPDGSLIAVRTYGTVWIWRRAPGASVADAFAELPCEGPSAIEAQGEAIAFDRDGGGYVTAGEGTNPPMHYFRP